MDGVMSGYAELEFDLPSALLSSVLKSLGTIEAVPLTMAATSQIPEEQGVYQIFHEGRPVYVGKTDAEAGLARRLLRHSRKIVHRRNLDPNSVTFKALRIYVFTAMDIESDLIKAYGGVRALAWNGSGFGSNDPGRERDTTRNKAGNFDALYPADIDLPLVFDGADKLTASEALSAIRAKVPWSLRAQRRSQNGPPHAARTDTLVKLPPGIRPARPAIAEVVGQLPTGWQATKLLGYVILYKERREYPDAEIIALS
ncbi:MAG: GIY-YIG nuclease family protein [Pseudolabrys sp.]|nr:GIY-YIG nuclease family protein [Pseudolabrys sp.]